MAFRLVDVKKTVRSRSDGARYVHPGVLDPAAMAAQVTLALAYFGSRLGRTRREVDPETLVRFFGDARVARGLIACLGTSYRWRTQEFAEVLEPTGVARLAAHNLHTPSDLRLYLYDALNREGDGFLAAEREEHLRPLARRLHLTTAKLDQLVALDAEENAVLVRIGPVPAPEEIVARYNYHTVDALLRNSVYVDLERVDGAGRAALEACCGLYGVTLSVTGTTVRLHNTADPFGSYARAGVRLTRALYTAAAAAPALLRVGRAQVRVPGKTAYYLFDKATPRALTAGTGAVRCSALLPLLRDDWRARRAAPGGTGGWRLINSPEPIVCAAGLAVAPVSCRYDETTVLLWPLQSEAALGDLLALLDAGLEILPVVAARIVPLLPAGLPYAREVDGAAGIVAALAAGWGGGRVAVGEQALEALLAQVGARGFIPESEAREALGCATLDELGARLRPLDPERGLYVAGLGVCSPAFAVGMRKGLRRRRQRRPAA